jgi:AcrR family transcriptional regulator
VFERDGFHDARLADVTREAKVSTGTLYNYFQSEEELFRAVIQVVLDDRTEPAGDDDRRPEPASGVVQGIIDANRSYVAGCRKNARLMSLLS